MPRLGVNIDHVATLRQQRLGAWPSPVWAAQVAEQVGVDSIVCHLREDRRHIQDQDVWDLKTTLDIPLNLEMACAQEVVDIAAQVRPYQATLVPERREELTTEGGLDVVEQTPRLKEVVAQLQEAGILVSLFVAPDERQLEATAALGVSMVELHTGAYADADQETQVQERDAIAAGAVFAKGLGLNVAAGHGLDYTNVKPILEMLSIEELNIGYSIIAKSLEVGLQAAVEDMFALVRGVQV